MSKLALFGSGGHARVVADAARMQGSFTSIHFYSDSVGDQDIATQQPKDASLLPDQVQEYDGLLIAIGDNNTRDDLFRTYLQMDSPLVSIIHPSATIANDAHIAKGCVVLANAVVNPNARIGGNSIINTACIVEHDCELGESVHISPGVAIGGGVTIGDRSWIGLGANVKHGISIAEDVVIGAGATVVHSITEPGTYVGVPARLLT